MPYQLVLQFKGATIEDFDSLIEFEDELVELLELQHQSGEVDGHDFGQDEMNVFVMTEDAQSALKVIQQHSQNRLLNDYKAAYRMVGADIYTPAHPASLREFRVL